MTNEEKLVMGVTKLNSADIFLGHEWLKHHNPSIDWTHGQIVFDRCPEACTCLKMPKELESDVPEDWTIRAVMKVFEEETVSDGLRPGCTLTTRRGGETARKGNRTT